MSIFEATLNLDNNFNEEKQIMLPNSIYNEVYNKRNKNK